MGKVLHIDPWAYVFGAFLVLTVPLDWLVGALVAAVVHELSHIVAIRSVGGSILDIHIGIGGAVIDSHIPGKGRELLCALAGPAGSLLLVSLCRVYPKLAICGLIQGSFNLLPVFPLDGGRILRCLLVLVCPMTHERISRCVERLVIVFLILLAVAGTFCCSMGFLPIVVGMVLIIKKKTLQSKLNQGTIVLPFVKR